MKKALAVLVLLVVVGLCVVYVRLGLIVKSAAQAYGSKALGAPVSVGMVTVSPFSGKARVTNVTIGNPPGFTASSALRVRDIRVELDMASLRGSGPVIVRQVLIDGVEVTYEVGAAGSNVARLQKNLAAYAPSQPKEKSAAGRPVKLALFKATGAKTRLVVPQLGQDREVALPDLELKDVGGSSGATAQQAAQQILSALVSGAVRAAGGAGGLLEEAKKALPGALQNLFR